MQTEKKYSCNLEEFKKKVNTFVGIKGNIRSLVLSLLIKLSQISPYECRSSLGQTTLNSHALFYSIVLVLLVSIIFLQVLQLSRFHNVDYGLRRAQQLVS